MTIEPLLPASAHGSVLWFSASASDTRADGQSAARTAVTAGIGPRLKVLVVDDEILIADSVAEILNRNGYDATALYGGAEAIRHVEEECPDIVVADVIMPDLEAYGWQLLSRPAAPGQGSCFFPATPRRRAFSTALPAMAFSLSCSPSLCTPRSCSRC